MKIALDTYTYRARLLPALLLLLPLLLSALVWIPSLQSASGFLVAVVGGVGGIMLISQLGRDAGVKKEPLLLAGWGGKPTTILLRHRDSTIEKNTKARYHAFLKRNVPGLKIPTAKSEQNDSAGADSVYESATAWLIAQTRDWRKYDLIFEENVSYGFRRNLWALRSWGLSFAWIISVADVVGIGLLVLYFGQKGPSTHVIAAALASVVMALLWSFRITPEWVKIPALGYAKALLQFCDKHSNNRTGKRHDGPGCVQISPSPRFVILSSAIP